MVVSDLPEKLGDGFRKSVWLYHIKLVIYHSAYLQYDEADIPSKGAIRCILNENKYHLRKVRKTLPPLRAMESRRLRPVVRSRRRFLADRFAGTAKVPDFSLISYIPPLGCLSSRDWSKLWGNNEESGAWGV